MQSEYLLNGEKPRESITKKVVIGALLGTAAVFGYANYHGTCTTTPTKLVASSSWGKQDYINFQTACYGKGDSAAAGSNNYHTVWDTTVNKCLYAVHGTSAGSTSNVPSQWGKSDYDNYLWSCFTMADTAASGSSDYHSSWDNTVNNCMANMFMPKNAMSYVASMSWGKQDYINYDWSCYSQGDAAAANSGDYHDTWDTTVNKCFGATYCPNGSPLDAPSAWGKQDYENFVWGCFGKGDSAAANSGDYHTTWNNAVNTCLTSEC
jgi:hypothetical protein